MRHVSHKLVTHRHDTHLNNQMSLQKENYKRDILTTNTKKKQSTIHINSLKIKKKKKHNILHWIVIKADELQMSS